jgi:hypothetical protein
VAFQCQTDYTGGGLLSDRNRRAQVCVLGVRRCLVRSVGADRADCHDSRMTKKWCLSCQDWVEPDKRRIPLEREGGSGMERRPSPVVEVWPTDDRAASAHLLVDAPPA